MDTSQLLLSILWGAIGMGYFVYGKKQKRFLPLLSGIALMAFPCWLASVGIGLALAAIPFVIR